MSFQCVHVFSPATMARWRATAALALLPVFLTACQQSNVTGSALLAHQMQSDTSGLKPAMTYAVIHASVAPPRNWTQLPTNRGVLYTHQQWRSPDHGTGIGIAYIHLPLPASPQFLLFLAKTQYAGSGRNGTGHLQKQWTDSLGRLWFEAEDSDYHIRGYAMTRGLDAWIVYSGHRLRGDVRDSDIGMANRTADAVVPFLDPETAVATANPPGHF